MSCTRGGRGRTTAAEGMGRVGNAKVAAWTVWAPQSRAGASHSLCDASASGQAVLHGTSAAGRYAPFNLCP